jgi:hypothetical protein
MRAFFSTFPFLFLVLSSAGQDLRNTKAVQQACGPVSVKYDKGDGLDKHAVLPAVPPGKALLYLVQLEGTAMGSCIGSCVTVVKFGLDGEWKGALWGNSFVFAAMEPGDHHICVNSDVRVNKLEPLVALHGVHAEAGKTYIYGVRVSNVGGTSGVYGLELEPLDGDEASMLLEAYPLSKMKPKP